MGAEARRSFMETSREAILRGCVRERNKLILGRVLRDMRDILLFVQRKRPHGVCDIGAKEPCGANRMYAHLMKGQVREGAAREQR